MCYHLISYFYLIFYICPIFFRENKNGKSREWNHKLVTSFSFFQGMNARAKTGKVTTWNTGLWKKKYTRLAKGDRASEGNTTAIYRARHVLTMRENVGRATTVSAPTKGRGFFLFEEDLPHHIREALVVCSTGISVSFFDNYHVKSLLKGLNPRHRPVYRIKLARIILVIHEVLTTEVSIYFMC